MSFWEVRRDGYETLQYVSNEGFNGRLVQEARLDRTHRVLDLGAGTGLVKELFADAVAEVVEIDLEADALSVGIKMDARQLNFPDDRFDRVVARMMLHHVIDRPELVFKEAFRVLGPCGRLIVADGTPTLVKDPNLQSAMDEWYGKLLRKKEGVRLVFNEGYLAKNMVMAGFVDIAIAACEIPGLSTKRWLDTDKHLSVADKQSIMQMMREAPDFVKEGYNQIDTGDDILNLGRYVIVSGAKPT